MMVLAGADDQIVGHEIKANIPAMSDISKFFWPADSLLVYVAIASMAGDLESFELEKLRL